MSFAESRRTCVRPDVQAYIDLANAYLQPKFEELPLAQLRALPMTMRATADVDPRQFAVINGLSIPSTNGAIPARLYDSRRVAARDL